jgi:hypothetical protein
MSQYTSPNQVPLHPMMPTSVKESKEKRNQTRLLGQSTNFYCQLLPKDSETRKRLEQIFDRSPVELTSLYEEIAATKLAAEDGLKLFDRANELPLKEQIGAKNMAYSMLHKCFTQIGRLAETAARIDQYNRTASAVHIARIIIDEAGQIAERQFRHVVDESFIQEFKNNLMAAFEIDDPTVQSPRRLYPDGGGELQLMDEFTTGEK